MKMADNSKLFIRSTIIETITPHLLRQFAYAYLEIEFIVEKMNCLNDSSYPYWIILHLLVGRKRSDGEFPAARFRLPFTFSLIEYTHCALVIAL